MSETKRILIVGVGSIGLRHLRCFQSTGRATLSFCEVNQALRAQVAKERKIDLSQYFPDLNLGDVQNIEKRNNILLDHLLKQSKSRLQLGLDLKGGVAFITPSSITGQEEDKQALALAA